MSLMRSKIRSHERGATLIEVMIALLILAVGLLGFASMQTQGLVTGRQAYLHSTAAFLAEDMVERMRANLAQSPSYSMTFDDNGSPNHCDTTNCSAVDLMRWDQNIWQTRVGNSLPNGQGLISASQGSNAYVSVTIKICYTLETGNSNSVDCATTAAAPASTAVNTNKQYVYVMTTQLYPN